MPCLHHVKISRTYIVILLVDILPCDEMLRFVTKMMHAILMLFIMMYVMYWIMIKITLIWIQGLSQLWNFEIRMITHLCHDLEIDIKGLPFFKKGLPFFLTMTKGEIASLHNSRRKQKLHFSKEKKLLSWTSPRIASLKHQENAKMCYRAYLKKSKYANLHIFEFASL